MKRPGYGPVFLLWKNALDCEQLSVAEPMHFFNFKHSIFHFRNPLDVFSIRHRNHGPAKAL